MTTDRIRSQIDAQHARLQQARLRKLDAIEAYAQAEADINEILAIVTGLVYALAADARAPADNGESA